MSGWTTPDQPRPVVGWEAPSEPEGLGIRESIGAGWRVFRAKTGTLVATAVVPEIVRNLLVIPSVVIVLRAWEAMIDVFTSIDWENYLEDQLAIQQRLEDAFRPPTDLAVLSGLTSGVSIAVALVGFTAVTAATLAVVDGRPPSVGAAYRAVAARFGSLVVPALILGLCWGLVGTVLTLNQGSLPSSDTDSLRARTALSAVLGLVGFILTVTVVVLVVRWSLAIPAILAEDLTLRRGLSRSAELTSGIRVRIFVIFVVIAIVVGFLFSAFAFVAAFIVGVATLSLEGGVAGYLVVMTIAGFFWLPFAAAVLSYIYRVRAGPVNVAATEPQAGPTPDAPSAVDPAPSA